MKIVVLILVFGVAVAADMERRISYPPYFMRYPSYYRRPPQKSTPSLYSFLVPLALLGITLPAMGLMYTYFSRRRRRDLQFQYQPSLEQLEQYLDILKASLQRFQRQLDDDPLTQ